MDDIELLIEEEIEELAILGGSGDSEGNSAEEEEPELSEVCVATCCICSINVSLEQDVGDELDEQHCAPLPEKLEMKKDKAADIYTIFSERKMVQFSSVNGKSQTLKGCWCNEYKLVRILL